MFRTLLFQRRFGDIVAAILEIGLMKKQKQYETASVLVWPAFNGEIIVRVGKRK